MLEGLEWIGGGDGGDGGIGGEPHGEQIGKQNDDKYMLRTCWLLLTKLVLVRKVLRCRIAKSVLKNTESPTVLDVKFDPMHELIRTYVGVYVC